MDRRVRKTRSAIKDAFLKLARKNDVNKIKVSELAELADINRKTFYLHYIDIYDVLEEIKEEFIKQADFLASQISVVMLDDDITGFVNTLFETLEVASKRFKYILDTEVYSSMINCAKQHFKEMLISEYIKLGGKNVEFLSYMFTFYASGILDAFREWYENHNNVSRDEIIQLICVLIDDAAQIIDIDL